MAARTQAIISACCSSSEQQAIHQENGSFTFFVLFVLFHAFLKKSRKSMKKPSPLLARVLFKLVRKVDHFSKVPQLKGNID